jgi:hypothetical protein
VAIAPVKNGVIKPYTSGKDATKGRSLRELSSRRANKIAGIPNKNILVKSLIGSWRLVWKKLTIPYRNESRDLILVP